MKTNRTVVGVDTAKRVFQLHWVDMETGEIVDLRLMRAKFLEHFANRAPCLVAMEACGGSQHWARRIWELGHEVRLLPAKMVRPFVGGNKNDAHDARAIWTAVQQPGVKTVAIKSEEQQAMLALHRMRQQLVKFRTAQINGLRGLLTEYGEVMPKGRAGMRRDIPAALERVSERLPAMVIETLREQWARVAELDKEVGVIERRIKLWHRGNAASRQIAEIPGVGVLSATAVVAAMGDPAAFRSGREFAAWLGLVPRPHQPVFGKQRQNPAEHPVVDLMRQAAPGPRQPGMVGNTLRGLKTQKCAQRQRIRTTPLDPPFGIDPLEIAHHVHPEIPPRRNRWRPIPLRVIRRADRLDIAVETRPDQNFLKPVVENVTR